MEYLARTEVRLQLPVPGVSQPDAPGAEGLEPRSKPIEVAREEPVAVVEDSGVVDHVGEEGTSGLDLLGRLEDGAERDGLAARARRSQVGLETLLDGKELVHPGEASRA